MRQSKSKIVYKGIEILNLTFSGHIYCIFEEVDNTYLYHYIGMTTKPDFERIDEHILNLKEKTHHNHRLQELYDTRKDLIFTVAIIENVIAANIKDLLILLRHKEKQYIKKYKPTCNIVHNVSKEIKIKSKDKTISNVIILSKLKKE